MAVSGLDKTSKCREEAVQASLANNTAPLYETALAHTGREQVQRQALAASGWHQWGEKQIIPPISTPILRHIGITTDVRKGRLDGLYYSPPLPGDTQIIAHQVLRGRHVGSDLSQGKEGSPRERIDSDLFFTFSPVCSGLRRRKLNDYETFLSHSPTSPFTPRGLWMTVSRGGFPRYCV